MASVDVPVALLGYGNVGSAFDQLRCLGTRLGEPLVGAGAERTGECVDLWDGRTSLLVHAFIAADGASRECNDFVPNS